MPNHNVMTDDELHEFGIKIVLDDLRKNGFTIVSVIYESSANPQITAKRNGYLLHVLTRTACYPNKGRIETRELGYQALQDARRKGARCFFASVGIANSEGTTDIEMAIPIRGAGYYVSYSGIEELTPENINSMAFTSESKVYNQSGNIAGSVVMQPDSRHLLETSDSSDYNSLVMSLFIIFASDLTREQQLIFSRWAHMPENVWAQAHAEFFAMALMHYFLEVKVNGGNLPSSLAGSIRSLSPQALPDLPYPLTNQIRNLFSSLFSNY